MRNGKLGWRCKVKVSYLFEVNKKNTGRHAYAEIAEITGIQASIHKTSIFLNLHYINLTEPARECGADAEMTGHKMNFVLCVLMRVRIFL